MQVGLDAPGVGEGAAISDAIDEIEHVATRDAADQASIPLRFHVAIDPPEGGLRARSFVLCDQPRAISIERTGKRIGSVSPTTLALVEMRLRILFGL